MKAESLQHKKLCEITNIPKTTLYDNLRRFREEKSKMRCREFSRKKFLTRMTTDGPHNLLLLIRNGQHNKLPKNVHQRWCQNGLWFGL